MEKIEIIFEHVASFDVDAQKGFTFLCPTELPIKGGDQIVDELNLMATFAKHRVGSKDAHCLNSLHISDEYNPQFSKVVGVPNIDIRWNKHCIMGEMGAESLDNLPHWSEYDFFVWKGIEPDVHVYGACFHDLQNKLSTGVIEWLKINKTTTVLVGGLATDFCVKTTAIQLKKAGFNVIVNLKACRGIDVNESLEIALNEMTELGIILINDLEYLIIKK